MRQPYAGPQEWREMAGLGRGYGMGRGCDSGPGAGPARRPLLLALLLAAVLVPMLGCSGFFLCQNKPSCPATTGTGSGTGSTAVDEAYVAYTTTSASTTTATLVGYNIASGTLAPVTSVALPFIPVALAVSRNNSFLYVASTPGSANPGVYGYAIGSTGTLTALNGGNVFFTDGVAAMATSPDGSYLYTLSAVSNTMTEYSLSATTGALSRTGVISLPLSLCGLGVATPVTQTCSVAVSPTNSYAVASLGQGGDAVFGYATGTGITNNGALTAQIAAGTASGDFSVAIDGSNNAYIAQTAGLTVYGLTSGTPINRGTVSYAGNAVPRSVVVDPESKFVFTANEGTSTVSAFTAGTSTALTAVSGSPFAAPASVAALGVDSTDSYLVAAGYNATAGLQLYSIASSGVLSALAQTAGTTAATQYPVLVAMTH